MKILVCTSEYPPEYSSGIGNVVMNVTTRLEEQGVECVVCSPTGPDVKVGNSSLIRHTGVMGLVHFWNEVSMEFANAREEFSLCWAHNPLFVSKPPFHKLVGTYHSTYLGESRAAIPPLVYKGFASRIEKHAIGNFARNGGRFTAVDESVRSELVNILGGGQDIPVVANGVDVSLFLPSDSKERFRAKFGLPSEGTIVLSLGRLTWQKRPLDLIRVFSYLKGECDATLVIAGSGELLQAARKLVKNLGVDNVMLLGYIKDKVGLYKCADYFIMASKYEGHPLTLLEAMSSGLPCIVSNLPNLDVVRKAKCGIIVDFDDCQAAASEIRDYISKSDASDSVRARSYAVNCLDWRMVASRYHEIFERVAESGTR